jgi:hypothetical protein
MVSRIPQNKRGEARNGNIKTKHRMNVMTVNFLGTIPMDFNLFFLMKLADIAAIPFDRLSHIKAINT